MSDNKIEICTVGGFGEVGRNMTAVKVGNEVVVWDMGLCVQKVVEYDERGFDRKNLSKEQLMKIGAIPDDRKLASWKKITKAIVASHCHLDHIAAMPFMAQDYPAPIYGTPYTNDVLKSTIQNERKSIPNQIRDVQPNSTINVSKNIKVELINIPHSTPQTSLLAVHTKKGIVLYATDFKLDNHPVVGKKPNYDKIKELGDIGVRAIVLTGLYARSATKTPSEVVAREMLRDVMLGTQNDGSAIIVSCFASHIARIKSIIDMADKLNRKTIILGRSFGKYIEAAENAGITKLSNKADIVMYRNDVKRKLRDIEDRGPEKYVVICTGGQGEKNAVLTRILRGEHKFKFQAEDHLIFSNKVIPVEPNITNRRIMEEKLQRYGVNVFKDVHVSGHPAKEDLREMLKLTRPDHIIPCHGFPKLVQPTETLADEMGYKVNRDVHIMHNGNKLKIPA